MSRSCLLLESKEKNSINSNCGGICCVDLIWLSYYLLGKGSFLEARYDSRFGGEECFYKPDIFLGEDSRAPTLEGENALKV